MVNKHSVKIVGIILFGMIFVNSCGGGPTTEISTHQQETMTSSLGTSLPSRSIPITPTAISMDNWKEYSVLPMKVSLKYPENWFIHDGNDGDISFITISSFEGQKDEKQNTELVVPSGEFLITLYIDPGIKLQTYGELLDWVNNNDPGRGILQSTDEIEIDGTKALVRIYQIKEGYRYETIYLMTQIGLLQIHGENMDSGKAIFFNTILSSLQIGG